MKIGILGGGTMGEIIVRALLHKEVFRPAEIAVAELLAERRQVFEPLEVEVVREGIDLLAGCDLLMICVKPQYAVAAMAPLRGKLQPGTLVVSIMAGVDIPFIAERLDHPLVVHSMPNLPARIGRGVTVWCAAPEVPDGARLMARMVFQAMGSEVEVEQEDQVDAATAVSGTGPAYIFYIAENLMEAALGFGFDERQALKLVRQTFSGAMDLWAETGESPVALRHKVTSKGGTTHAAVTYFQQRDIAGIFRAGVHRAYQRAKELAAGIKGEG